MKLALESVGAQATANGCFRSVELRRTGRVIISDV
jgi:hypothetical protein